MKLLADSDFLFALFKPDDSNNSKSRTLLEKYEKEDILISNLVLQEATTLVSKRMGMKYAVNFYNAVLKITSRIIYLDLNLEKKAWKMFLDQTKKGCSFIDCSNLIIHNEHKLNGILSFDDFYPREVIIK